MINLWRSGVRFWQQLTDQVVQTTRQGRWWSRIFLRALQQTLAPETALTSAAIGYFTLFSLFPLTLLSVAIASLWFDPLWAESEIVTQLEFVAPALGELLGNNLERIVVSRGPVTGVALLILLWSASNIFNVLTRALDKIWDVPAIRPVWRHRGLAMVMALGISFLLLAAFFAEGTVLTILGTLLPEELMTLRPYTNQLWAALVSVALFAILYYLLPHVKLTWRQVMPGAAVAGLVWEGAKRFFLYFIGVYLSRSNLVYGSLTTIMLFLTWTYVSSMIFLFGAYLNVEYLRRQKGKPRE